MRLLKSTQWLRLVALLFATNSVCAQEETTPPAPPEDKARPAMIAAKAAHGRLLDIVKAGKHLVAVGEQGLILISHDGKTWKQIPSPNGAMLTRVRFVTETNGWAIGYDATILQTNDGGNTWTLKHRDVQGRALFDILFRDAQHGIAVGGYGTYMETRDGGQTWQRVESPLSTIGMHLNAIVPLPDGSLFIAGERGLAAHSTDEGATWRILDVPYAGSWFGALSQGDKGALIYGMRGNIFIADDLARCRSIDAAKWDSDNRPTITDSAGIAAHGWRKVTNPWTESLFGAVPLDGSVLFLGVNGTVLKLDDPAGEATPLETPARETLSAGIVFEKQLIAVGRRGAQDLGAAP